MEIIQLFTRWTYLFPMRFIYRYPSFIYLFKHISQLLTSLTSNIKGLAKPYAK